MRELSAAAHVRSWPGYAPPQYRLSCGRCLFIRQGLSSLDFEAQLLPNSTLPTCPRHQRWPPERGSPEVALQGGSPTPGWLRSGPQRCSPRARRELEGTWPFPSRRGLCCCFPTLLWTLQLSSKSLPRGCTPRAPGFAPPAPQEQPGAGRALPAAPARRRGRKELTAGKGRG